MSNIYKYAEERRVHDDSEETLPRFLLLYGAMFAAFGVASPFLPGLLRQDGISPGWLGVVLAAAGYPESPRKGDAITGLDTAAKLPGKVFHAGTARQGEALVTSGGRVMCAVGLGTTVREAQQAAYALVDVVDYAGKLVRRDIGYRAIAREEAAG